MGRQLLLTICVFALSRSTNQYGYEYHFDIQATSEVFGDNPVVDFEQVTCPSQAVSDYQQCQCAT